jgi:hypothetical protein
MINTPPGWVSGGCVLKLYFFAMLDVVVAGVLLGFLISFFFFFSLFFGLLSPIVPPQFAKKLTGNGLARQFISPMLININIKALRKQAKKMGVSSGNFKRQSFAL